MQITSRLTFAMPADYARYTGGWAYDQRIVRELEALGWTIGRMTLPAGFPRPDERAQAESARLIADLPDDTILLADQLALGVLPEVAVREGARLRLAMIVHHPLALEEGLSRAESERFHKSERSALRHAALTVVPSAATADALMSDYDVPTGRIALAPPGTDPRPLSPASSDGTLRLLSIGSLVPRKDHGTLIGALADLENLPWRLTIVGSPELAPEHAERIRKMVSDRGLEERIELTGVLDAAGLEPLWHSADLYAAASRHEGYGMAIAEAISRGIPVVSTDAGAVGRWIDRRAAIVVPAGDADALHAALRSVIGNRKMRAQLRAGAIEARASLPTWPASAALIDRRLRTLIRAQKHNS